ncbi:glycosyltransferase family 4 protein [Sphingosinicella rhizophila]|uniref:Glycosyltransferase family 4 protein n=1 Tax=Sphingosinicella rhizophila TaxID=3050082 RepID=A0ABU3QAH8_9SPHN|nr:glycosyltransferase family 4 protein [Sphingosinicella sp. GR2756]MDT9600389.1 glycosyltransferase family 4 protein [Sphingosinicella sp. GR2756]
MSDMRIMMTADAVGGVWQYSIDLARGLSRLGIETVLATMGPAMTARQRAEAAEIPELRLIETGLVLDWMARDASAVREASSAIEQIAKECEADIIQLSTPALAAQSRFHAPVVAVQHSCVATWWDAVHGSELPADFQWRAELVRQGLAAASIVITPTAAFGHMTQRRYDLPTVPRTIHNGRTPLALTPRAAHDFVFTAGRLWDDGKNLRTIDAAAARIGVPIHAAGSVLTPQGAEVKFDHIHCLGLLDEDQLGQWLAARPVFVSAALYEPFGLAVLEAAAAGCALILSDIPTFRELWEDVAIFIPARNHNAFAHAMAELVGDDCERARMGRAARERAARFTPDAMAAQMASIYRSLLPAASGPRLTSRVAA